MTQGNSVRPLYETQDDIDREYAVALSLAHTASLEPVKMPRQYPVDYALIHPETKLIKCWIEVKCRTNASDRYPTYMVSYAKLLKMLELHRASRLPCRMAVQWTDRLGSLDITAPHDVGFGGRRDRSDWQDMEPVAYFPVSEFKSV